MRAMAWIPFTGALGAGLLSGTLFLSAGAQLTARLHPSAPLHDAAGRVPPPAPRDDFDRLIREAQRWHIESWRVVNDQRYALEAWDSAVSDRLDQAAWRQLTALDLFGCLRRARRIARQAAALAHTSEEEYRAALLLAVLACEAGDHRAEGQQVRQLARLSARSLTTQLWLRHVTGHRTDQRFSQGT
jgi:hypothetical protein